MANIGNTFKTHRRTASFYQTQVYPGSESSRYYRVTLETCHLWDIWSGWWNLATSRRFLWTSNFAKIYSFVHSKQYFKSESIQMKLKVIYLLTPSPTLCAATFLKRKTKFWKSKMWRLLPDKGALSPVPHLRTSANPITINNTLNTTYSQPWTPWLPLFSGGKIFKTNLHFLNNILL